VLRDRIQTANSAKTSESDAAADRRHTVGDRFVPLPIRSEGVIAFLPLPGRPDDDQGG
jgi:hypothetical protein